ncbi:unnamed protein product, partial [Bubo scandiacus]
MSRFPRAHCPGKGKKKGVSNLCLLILHLQPLLDNFPQEAVFSESDLVTPSFSLKFPCWKDWPPPQAPVLSGAGSPQRYSGHVWPPHSYRE